MTELTKEQIVFTRGENGKLIPQDVILESLEDKPSVKVVPLTRGKLQEIYQKATSNDIDEKLESDNDVIKCGLVSPKLNDDEIKDMKPHLAAAITQAILSVSLNISQKEIGEKTNEAVANQELALLKK